MRERIGLSLMVLLVTGVTSVLLLETYSREVDYLLYRLAVNLHNGYGIVYNPDSSALLTFSPLWIVPLAIAPFEAPLIAAGLYIMGLVISAFGLTIFLKRTGLSTITIALVLLIFSISYPVWAGFRSPAAWTFALVILSLNLIDDNRLRLAGLLAGMTLLLQAQGIIGIIICGIYALSRSPGRYWQTVWLPAALWGLFALAIYDMNGLTLSPPYISADGRDALWLGLFVIAVSAISRTETDNRLWLFPLWAALETGGEILFAGQFLQITGLPLALTVAIGATTFIRLLAPVVIVGSTALLVVAPPQTSATLQTDLDAVDTLNIPAGSSIAHDRGDAFTYMLSYRATAVYHLDGERSPTQHDFVRRGDMASLLVMLAPDFVYTETLPVNPDAPNIAALDYIQTDTTLWERTTTLQPFTDAQDRELAFSSDVTLDTVGLAGERINASDTLRVRLDWSLDRAPEDEIGININLLDHTGNPVSSIFPAFPLENWQTPETRTYHALDVPADLQPGLHTIQVALDYRAGILDNHSVSEVVIPLPQPETVENRIGTLGPVTLYITALRVEEERLTLDLVWQTTEPLERDYRVFVHVATPDDPQPLAQDDGLPLNGRYPAYIWQPDEYVTDLRTVDISALPPGEYVVNIGLYTPDTGRLQNSDGDFLRAGTITLD